MNDYIFYKGKPHVFSNFHPAEIELDGKVWPTSEHYFQAMKFRGIDENYVEEIRLVDSPSKCYALAWSKPARADWDSVRDGFMKRALLSKFSQHSEFEKELLKTGDKNIIQRCSRDKYWGDGYPGKGENMLGKLLMEVRSELITKIRKEISRIGSINNGGTDFSKGLRIVKIRDWSLMNVKEKNEFIRDNFDDIFNYRPSWFDNEFISSTYMPNIDLDSIEFKQLKELILSRDDINYDPILKEMKKLDENIMEGRNPYGHTVPVIQDYIISIMFPEIIEKERNGSYKYLVPL